MITSPAAEDRADDGEDVRLHRVERSRLEVSRAPRSRSPPHRRARARREGRPSCARWSPGPTGSRHRERRARRRPRPSRTPARWAADPRASGCAERPSCLARRETSRFFSSLLVTATSTGSSPIRSLSRRSRSVPSPAEDEALQEGRDLLAPLAVLLDDLHVPARPPRVRAPRPGRRFHPRRSSPGSASGPCRSPRR